MHNLGWLYHWFGRTKEAVEMHEKLLKAILGEEHQKTLATMHDLALAYRSVGRTKEAAEMQEKVL